MMTEIEIKELDTILLINQLKDLYISLGELAACNAEFNNDLYYRGKAAAYNLCREFLKRRCGTAGVEL